MKKKDNEGSGAPRPPSHLAEGARKVWEESAAVLPGPWSGFRLQQLEAYAVSRAMWLECDKHVAEHGPVVICRNDKGAVKSVIQSPQVLIGSRARTEALKLAAALGFGRIGDTGGMKNLEDLL